MRISVPIATVLVLLLPTSALATGTVHITQKEGLVQTYVDVAMKVNDHTLTMMSADRVSTVTIRVDQRDCAPANGLVYCTGGTISLRQRGVESTIPLKAAKFYINMTDQEQSSDSLAGVLGPAGCQVASKVAPHTVAFALLTGKGTHITGNGKLD